MLALLARTRTGRGQAIEVTMLQGNAWANADEAYDYNGRPPYALPDEQCYGLNALYRLYQTSEGWVFLACPFDREWKAFCTAVNRPDLRRIPGLQVPPRAKSTTMNSPTKSEKSSLRARPTSGNRS